MTADHQFDRMIHINGGYQLTFHTQDEWIGNRVPIVSTPNEVRTYLVHKSKDSVS